MKKKLQKLDNNDLNVSGGGKWAHFFGGVSLGALATIAISSIGGAILLSSISEKNNVKNEENSVKTNDVLTYFPPSSSVFDNKHDSYKKIAPEWYTPRNSI